MSARSEKVSSSKALPRIGNRNMAATRKKSSPPKGENSASVKTLLNAPLQKIKLPRWTSIPNACVASALEYFLDAYAGATPRLLVDPMGVFALKGIPGQTALVQLSLDERTAGFGSRKFVESKKAQRISYVTSQAETGAAIKGREFGQLVALRYTEVLSGRKIFAPSNDQTSAGRTLCDSN